MSTAIADLLELTSTEISELSWRPLNGFLGVQFKTLWHDPKGNSYSGLIKMRPGASVPPHRHHFACHHAWVESGSCRIGPRTLGPGGYLYVSAGVEHGIDEAGAGGCTLLYLYLTSPESND
jgi:quercetin dioxygenase-like cupin family protein